MIEKRDSTALMDRKTYQRIFASGVKYGRESMDSTSDERTANNVVRHEYRVLTDKEKAQMKSAKDFGLVFIQLCDDIDRSRPPHIGVGRELAIAKTKMEEAVMWAVKAITA